jgi:serine/threonine protein kinase
MSTTSPRPNSSANVPGEPLAAPGQQFDLRALGHYRVLRSIGSGGMSEVYLAYDSKKRCQVAIKVLADNLVSNQIFVNRFMQEGRLGKDLTHPHIVKAYDHGRDPQSGKYFMVMEFVDGFTAQERLETDGRIAIAEAVQIIIDIARALEYLHHQGYIHRDIKPGNILIGADGDAKLIDLGVAKYVQGSSSLTSIDQGVGTPFYMPWEQGMNDGLVDVRSDIFALGATFYHLLTGHVPFPGDDEIAIARLKRRGEYVPASRHLSTLPGLVDTILSRMLARDPRKRFSSAREVIEVLGASGLKTGNHTTEIELPMFVEQPLAPTRADLQMQDGIDTPLESGCERFWVVKFQRASDGAWRKLRGRTVDIIRFYEDAALPEEVFAAREPSEVFRRLKAYPEFRLISRRQDAPASSKKRPNPLRKPRLSGLGRPNWKPWIGTLIATGALLFLLYFAAIAVLRMLAPQQ